MRPDDYHAKANEAFYRAVTGDWHDLKLITVTDYLRKDGFPPEEAAKTLIAIVDAQNLKYGILHDWQNRINRWHAEGNWERCADIGPEIDADIDEAIAPLAPYADEARALADQVFEDLPEELRQAIR